MLDRYNLSKYEKQFPNEGLAPCENIIPPLTHFEKFQQSGRSKGRRGQVQGWLLSER